MINRFTLFLSVLLYFANIGLLYSQNLGYKATIVGRGIGPVGNPFNAAQGVAIDSLGNIYVVDTDSHRVQIFDSTFTYLETIGNKTYLKNPGSGNYDLRSPIDIFIDEQNKIYIVDKGNNRIQIFNDQYNYLATIGGNGSGTTNDKLWEPQSVTVDKSGKIYVADNANSRIQIFDANYNYLATIKGSEEWTDDDYFKDPVGVAVGPSGNIFIADQARGRILVYDTSYNYLTTVGASNSSSGNYQFSEIRDIAFDLVGNLYAPDYGNSRIQVYDSTLNYVYTIAYLDANNGNTKLRYVKHVTIDKFGTLYISNYGDLNILEDLPPSVKIESNVISPTPHNIIPINITFNERVTGFVKEDITVTNGLATNLQTTDSINFSAEIIPNEDGEIIAEIFANKVSEANVYNKGNIASNQFSIIYDHTPPAVNIKSFEEDSTDQSPLSFSITFDERVLGFNEDDIFVGNDSLSNFTPPHATFKGFIRAPAYPWLTPSGVCTDRSGNIYVAESANHRVSIYDSTYSFIGAIGGNGEGVGDNQFKHPLDVAVNNEGNVYVADRGNHRIQIFDKEFNYVATIGGNESGSGNNQFNYPSEVTVDTFGNIYVLDDGNDRIQIFDKDFNYLLTINNESIENVFGDIFDPIDIAVDVSNNLYICTNKHIYIFNELHEYTSTINTKVIEIYDDYIQFRDVAVDPAGNIFIVEDSDIIYVLSPKHEFMTSIGGEEDKNKFNNLYEIATDSEGKLYILESSQIRVFSFTDVFHFKIFPDGDGYINLTIPEESVHDRAGNQNNETSFSILYNKAPKVTITTTENSPTASNSIPIVFIFSEIVTTFNENSISIENGDILNLQTSDSITFTGDIIPIDNGKINIEVKGGAAYDKLGKGNIASKPFSIVHDTVGPVGTIKTNTSDSTNTNTVSFTINFNEQVVGFDGSDIQVINGNIIDFDDPGPVCIATIGGNKSGADNDHFTYPYDIATDKSGNIYVADQNNYRIQVFDTLFKYVNTIGGYGQLALPIGIAIDKWENIYVTNSDGYRRLNVFDKFYNYDTTFIYSGYTDKNYEINSPQGVTVDNSGKIYIADKFLYRVQIFDSLYKYVATIGGNGAGLRNDQLCQPLDVAIDRSGNIYITDSYNDRVQVFDSLYNYVATIGGNGKGSGNDQFNRPTGIDVDRFGNIYVVDENNNRVQVFDKSLKFIYTIGGENTNQLNRPNGVAVDAFGKIYVSNKGNHSVKVFVFKKSYDLTVAPNEDGDVVLNIPAGSVQDLAGNPNLSFSHNQLFNKAPAVSIKTDFYTHTNSSSIPVTIEFSEPVFDFDISSLKVENGVASNMGTNDSISFRTIISPVSEGTISIKIPSDIAHDFYGAGNRFGKGNFIYDTKNPNIIIHTAAQDSSDIGTIPLAVSIDEPVVGFEKNDLTVINGEITNFREPEIKIKEVIGGNGEGSANNQFYFPTSIATDQNGRFYIADKNNHRIQVFDKAYKYITTIGSGGAEIGQFNRVTDIAFDVLGNLYVADTYNHRIQVFDSAYNFITTIGNGRGSNNDQFYYPMGVAIDASGNLLVADYTNHRVQVFDTDYNYIKTIGGNGKGSNNDQLYNPTDITIDFKGNIYIADNKNHRVQVFDADYNYIRTIGGNDLGSGNYQFKNPYGVATDNYGNLYVVDKNNYRVQVFDSLYNYSRTIGSYGTDSSHFTNPQSVLIDASDNIYVTDCNSNRVQVFEKTLNYLINIQPESEGLVKLKIFNNGLNDLAGNGNEAFEYSFWNDSIAPTINITNTNMLLNGLIEVKVIFSEKVIGFDATKVNLQKGIIESLVTTDSITYNVEIAPIKEGEVSVSIPANIVKDLAGNYNLASTQVGIIYDVTNPNVIIESNLFTVTNDHTLNFHIIWSEPVESLTKNGIQIENGTVESIHTSDSINFILNIKPVTEGEVIVSIPADVAYDHAGNSNQASNVFSIIYDSKNPTVSLKSTESTPTSISLLNLDISFDEQVKNFSQEDIEVENAIITELSTSDSINFALFIEPVEDGEISVYIPADVLSDLAGNSNQTSDIFSILYDGTNPTVSLSSAEISPTSDSLFDMTIGFNEPVKNFTLDDIQIQNATLSNLLTSDSTIFSAQISPIAEGIITLQVPFGVAQDQAGNFNETSEELSILYEPISPEKDTLHNLSVEFITTDQSEVPSLTATLYQKVNNHFNLISEEEISGTGVVFYQLTEGEYTVGIQPSDPEFHLSYLGKQFTLAEAKIISLSKDTSDSFYVIKKSSPSMTGEAIITGVLLENSEFSNGRITADKGSYSGAPLPNVTLYLIHPASGDMIATTTTDQEGKFTFTSLPAGELLFIADYEGIPNDEKQNLLHIASDHEALTITVIAGNNIRVTEIQLDNQVTAVEDDLQQYTIQYYPNPVIDELLIEHTSSWLGGEIRVSDAFGKRLRTQKISSDITKMYIGELNNGVYIFTLTKSNNYYSFKIFKR